MSLLRQILFGLGLFAALAGWYLWTQHELTAARAEASQAHAHAKQLQGALTAARLDVHIVTHYVDRVQIVHERGATLTRRIPVYVTAQADARCVVPRGFVRLHDAAAAGIDLPASTGTADAVASGLALSAVAGTVVDNYTTCHATATQLTSLQEWVRAHSAAPTPAATGPP